MTSAEKLFERWVAARVDEGTDLDVDELAGDDGAIRQRLEELIASYRAIDAILPSPTESDDSTHPSPRPAVEREPPRVARYEVREMLGEGGMGEVWAAEQQTPIRRRVALKVIKKGLDTGQVIRRFESERQTLAAMDHPVIAKVLDAGATDDGRPYFAMERVDGVAITEACDRLRLTIRRRLELFIRVCDGVHHAHHKGVIHRDLKPSNVLLRREGDDLRPVIIDFGIAKAIRPELASDDVLTQLGQVVGTPAYMSPEQAELGHLDIDTRSDVYSLGVILFELLVGVRPHAERGSVLGPPRDLPPTPSSRVGSLGGAARDIAERRRSRVSAMSRALKGELDWITLKALHPERDQRYDSAAQLADDLRRMFRDEPVLAGPPGAGYRLRKFVRRHRVGVAFGVALLVAILSAVGGLVVGLDRALRAEERALAEKRLAQGVADFLVDLFERSDPTGDPDDEMSVHQLLDRGAARIGDELADQPEVQARLFETMGRAYSGLGDQDEAAALLRRAIERRLREGSDDLQLARSYADLAGIRMRAGDGDTSEGLRAADRALQIRRLHLPETSPEIAASHTLIGLLHWRDGDFGRARDSLERALTILEQTPDPAPGEMAKLLNNLGILRWEIGDLEGARAAMERGLELFVDELGPRHPHVASNLNNLGLVSERVGDLDAAARHHRRALEVRRAVLEPDHPDVAESLNNLGVVLNRRGEPGEARSALGEAIEIRRRVLGSTHPDLASSLANDGNALLALGDLPGARDRLEQAYSIHREQLGPDHPNLAYSLSWLAEVDVAEGRLADAERRIRECWRLRREALGERHPSIGDCLPSPVPAPNAQSDESDESDEADEADEADEEATALLEALTLEMEG